ncbi:unnamed protein product [Cylindrotheca closterium]|uniref:Protein kinase domain-containing protein n=1 Tax=Cylindrotheca closterium TaxID=2856 RepID=A0AAD2JKK7_9STRA|nr:unnamed protein product [Cylindrotheca closterium]
MLHDPLIEVLDKAWIELGLVPEKDGYLGSGAFGLVFKVCDQNGVALALKIVPDVDDNVAELQKQMSMTNEAKQKYPHLIFGVEENSFRKFDELGADILFSEVGNHYSSQRKLLLILFKSFTTTMWCMGMLDWTILSTSMGRPSELISKEHIFAKLIKFPRWNRSITKI